MNFGPTLFSPELPRGAEPGKVFHIGVSQMLLALDETFKKMCGCQTEGGGYVRSRLRRERTGRFIPGVP